MGSMFSGGDKAAQAAEQANALAARQAAAAQRRQLADLARQQAEVDQAKATGGGVRGRRLLTFLDSTLGSQQDGANTLGGAA